MLVIFELVIIIIWSFIKDLVTVDYITNALLILLCHVVGRHMRTLFIKNLPTETTPEQVKALSIDILNVRMDVSQSKNERYPKFVSFLCGILSSVVPPVTIGDSWLSSIELMWYMDG